jgi:hypothetical protein
MGIVKTTSGAWRLANSVVLQRDTHKRVLSMRHTFRRHRDRLAAVAIVAQTPLTLDVADLGPIRNTGVTK